MKKLIFILAFFSANAFSQAIYKKPNSDQYKKVYCEEIEVVFDALKKTIGGNVVIIAHADSNQITTVIIHNRETGKWAIVDTKDSEACVIAAGNKFQFKATL